MKTVQSILSMLPMPLAIAQDRLTSWLLKLSGITIPDVVAEDQQPRKTNWLGDPFPETEIVNGVAIVPLQNVLTKNPGYIERNLGVSSYVDFVHNMQDAADDPGVKAILIHANSPGGSVVGLAETGAAVARIARSSGKPVVAYVDEIAASACYSVICGASAIYASPSSFVGSIGVIAELVSIERALRAMGVDVAVVTSGEHKGIGHPSRPISEGDIAHVQGTVNTLAAEFKAWVSSRRPQVKADSTTGALFYAPEAKVRGLIDGTVQNIAALVSTLASGTFNPPAVRQPSAKQTQAPATAIAAPVTPCGVDTDTIYRAAANLNRVSARFEATANWYWNFLMVKSPAERSAVIAPLLAKSPLPSGDLIPQLRHVRMLLMSIAPQPNFDDLIAAGNYKAAWDAFPESRTEFTSYGPFEAYYRNQPAGRALAQEQKVKALIEVADRSIAAGRARICGQENFNSKNKA